MIGLDIAIALLAVAVFCFWQWCATEKDLDRVRGERDALRQMTNQDPNEDDVVMAMAFHEAFGECEEPGCS